MKISTRFSVGIHILTIISLKKDIILTSEIIAKSVNTNAVVIRRIIGMLKAAGLVDVKRGTGGTTLIKKAEDITLLQIYQAVSSSTDDHIFKFHNEPSKMCPVGENLWDSMEHIMEPVQNAMEAELDKVTIADVAKDIMIRYSTKIQD